ncbi:hypothetical protein CLOP_g15692 [Closterium sp. NIES-67]|nr:hypothetical protein CLOP_g15692 [Closterium sp. NIES-67]
MLAIPNLRTNRGGDYCRPCHHEPPPNPFCEQTGPWAADWAVLFDQHVPEPLGAGRRAVMGVLEGGRDACEEQVAKLSLEVRRRTNPSASLTRPPTPLSSHQQQASAATHSSRASLWQHLQGWLGGRPVPSGPGGGGEDEEQAASEEAAEVAWREAVRGEGWRAPAAAVVCVRHMLGKAAVFGPWGTGRTGSWSAFVSHLFLLNNSIALSLPAAPPSTDLLWDAHLLSAVPSMRLLMLPKTTAQPAANADTAAQQQSAAGGREVVAAYESSFAEAVRRIKANEEVAGRGAAAADADDALKVVGAAMRVDLIRVGAARLPDLRVLLVRGVRACQVLVDVEEGGETDRGGGDGRGVEELDAFLPPDDQLLAKWQGEDVLRELQRWLSGWSFHLDRCVSGNEERVGRCTFFSLAHCHAPAALQQTTTR